MVQVLSAAGAVYAAYKNVVYIQCRNCEFARPVKILHDFFASLGQVLLTRYYVAAIAGNVFCTGRHA